VKIEGRLFLILGIFFAASAVAYAVWGWLDSDYIEPVGMSGLILVSGLALMIAFYVMATARRIDDRPEDDPLGNIEEHAGEQGFYSPWSWWPLPVALSAAMIFLGLAVGWWVSIIGAAFGVLALVGWVYEYYRGQHAH
jgi:hypothetical protein